MPSRVTARFAPASALPTPGQRAAKTPGYLQELLRRQVREAEPHERSRRAIEREVLRERDGDAGLEGALLPAIEIDPRSDPRPQRDAAGGQRERQRARELALERRGERIASLSLHAPHRACVPRDVAIFDQLGDRALEHVIALAIDHRAKPREPIDHARMCGDEAEA